MSVEAMKQGLEALALFASDESDEGQVAIAAHEELRQAIKRQENPDENWNGWLKRDVYFEDGEPLMHSEPEWVGLTDEEILNLYTSITKSAWDCIMYARVIEARLKGMNHEPRQYKDLCGND